MGIGDPAAGDGEHALRKRRPWSRPARRARRTRSRPDVPDREAGQRTPLERPGPVDAAGPVAAARRGRQARRPEQPLVGAAVLRPRPGPWPSRRSGSPGRRCRRPAVPRRGAASRSGFIALRPTGPQPGLVQLPRPAPERRRTPAARWPPPQARPASRCPAAATISRCSSRCRARRTGSTPTRSAARRSPATAAATASSPMQWNPACRPARVHVDDVLGDLVVVQVAGPAVSASAYGCVQGGRPGADRAVDAQVTGQPGRADRPGPVDPASGEASSPQ